jgi:hypothetical protein
MRVKEFLASTPEEDYRGSCCADRAERSGLQQWLVERGLVRRDEYLLGVELTTRENHGRHVDPVQVIALMASRGDYPSIQTMIDATSLVAVRRVFVEMSVVEFFGLFKRLSLSFSTNGMLTNRRYAYLEP